MNTPPDLENIIHIGEHELESWLARTAERRLLRGRNRSREEDEEDEMKEEGQEQEQEQEYLQGRRIRTRTGR